MDNKLIKKYVKLMKDKGISESFVNERKTKICELSLIKNSISLLKTDFKDELELYGIKDNQYGHMVINQFHDNNENVVIDNILHEIASSPKNESYDIVPYETFKKFKLGSNEPDLDKMYLLLSDFRDTINTKYPQVNIEVATLKFNYSQLNYFNSNNTMFNQIKGYYSFFFIYGASNNNKNSTPNYGCYGFINLPQSLIDYQDIEDVIRNNIESIYPVDIKNEHITEVLLNPIVVGDFFANFIDTFLSDKALINKYSIFRNKLNKKIASEKLTLIMRIPDNDFVEGDFIKTNGSTCIDQNIIYKGILKSFNLSLYGLKKMQVKQNFFNCHNIYIPGEEESINDIIKSMKNGLIINKMYREGIKDNGDFCNIARNSLYVKNGEVIGAVDNIQVSGNIFEVINSIEKLSKDNICDGRYKTPYMLVNSIKVNNIN